MTDLIKGTIGYVPETTYALRARDGTVANTVTYQFGESLKKGFVVPIEKATEIRRDIFGSYDANSIDRGKIDVKFTHDYKLLEGHRLLYALLAKGDTEATGAPVSSIYPHTITPMQETDGNELNSVTVHVETIGLVTNKYIDICGCVTKQIDIGGSVNDKVNGVMISEVLWGQRITDEQGTHDTDGSVDATKAAAHYTATPAIKSANITSVDVWRLTKIEIGGVNILSDMSNWNIRVIVDLVENRHNRPDATNNYNVSIDHYVANYLVNGREYMITLNYKPTDATMVFFNKLQTQDDDLDLVIEYERTRGAFTHKHVWTFDTTQIFIEDITASVKFAQESIDDWSVILKPRSLVNLVIYNEESSLIA